jgi:hypothetical protein
MEFKEIITHLRLGLPSGLFTSGFPTNNLYALFSSPICATWSANLILLDLIVLIILGEEYKSRSPSLCSLLEAQKCTSACSEGEASQGSQDHVTHVNSRKCRCVLPPCVKRIYEKACLFPLHPLPEIMAYCWVSVDTCSLCSRNKMAVKPGI